MFRQATAPAGEPRVFRWPEDRGVFCALCELVSRRELLLFFLWRNFKLRYRQTLLGVAWAALKPLSLVVLCTAALGRFFHGQAASPPYPLFLYTGYLPWLFLSGGLAEGAQSVTASAQVLTKVYFPRAYLPLSGVLNSAVELAIGCVLLVPMAFWFGTRPTMDLLALPAILFLMVLFTFGLALAVAPLSARFRDVRHALPYLIQLWFFATPVIYPGSALPKTAAFLVELNPAAHFVSSFRGAMLGCAGAWGHSIGILVIAATCSLTAGFLCFRHFEEGLSELV